MPSRPDRVALAVIAFFSATVVTIFPASPFPASLAGRMQAQEPAQTPVSERGPENPSTEAVNAAIDALGSLEFPVRMNASRTLRRASAETVTSALIRAVESHGNQYVRFRALVLLTAFNDARTARLIREMTANPNDRLRTVAYMYFEHNPSAEMAPVLLKALEREESEFVRPALVRALAAHGSDARVRETLLAEVRRGQDFFRSAVIEALGDYRAAYAVEPLLGIAQLSGPLQSDAVIALGKIKDKRAMDVFAALQRSAAREMQPPVAAAICLLDVNCDAHLPYLIETLRFAERNLGYQALLRNAVAGLVALATAGRVEALDALVAIGGPAVDPPRAPIALGIATVAIRNTPIFLSYLAGGDKVDAAVALLSEGFDMLEEDYAEERFFAEVRRAYWQAPEGSAARKVGEVLIQKLEF